MPAIEFNPYSYELHEDPYPTYRALRDHAPVYRNDALGFWALSRHADVAAAFKDPLAFSNAEGVALERSSQAHASATASFLAMDPPRHDHMRSAGVARLHAAARRRPRAAHPRAHRGLRRPLSRPPAAAT